MKLLMKFYTLNHSHYHHLVPLTKRAVRVMDIEYSNLCSCALYFLFLVILQNPLGRDPSELKKIFARLSCVISGNYNGPGNTTVAEVLMNKGGEKVGSWLSCRSNETVQDAVTWVCILNDGMIYSCAMFFGSY